MVSQTSTFRGIPAFILGVSRRPPAIGPLGAEGMTTGCFRGKYQESPGRQEGGEHQGAWMGSMGCLLACRVLGFVFVLCFCCLVKHWTMLFFVRWSATQAIGKLNLLCLQRHCVTNFLALAAAPFWLHRASFALRFTLSLAGFVPSIRCTVRAE